MMTMVVLVVVVGGGGGGSGIYTYGGVGKIKSRICSGKVSLKHYGRKIEGNDDVS